MSDDLLEALAQKDFDQHVGHVVLAYWIYGYSNDTDDAQDLRFDPPIHVLVTDAAPDEIRHWNDNHLDPLWNVTPLDEHPNLKGLRSTWIHGISYDAKTGHREETRTSPAWLPRLTDGHERCLVCLAH